MKAYRFLHFRRIASDKPPLSGRKSVKADRHKKGKRRITTTRRIVCTSCGQVITPATYDAGHTYRLPVYELVTWQGQPAALRIGWRRVAVCGPCVARIHAAADRRVGLAVTRAAIEVHSA